MTDAEPDGVVRCLTPECEREPRCRGLCHSCYNVAAKLVWGKRTTWDTLVKAGKAFPPRVQGRRGTTRNHFLGNERS